MWCTIQRVMSGCISQKMPLPEFRSEVRYCVHKQRVCLSAIPKEPVAVGRVYSLIACEAPSWPVASQVNATTDTVLLVQINVRKYRPYQNTMSCRHHGNLLDKHTCMIHLCFRKQNCQMYKVEAFGYTRLYL